MADYLVTWEIDADNFDTPREAAEWARSRQRDPSAWVGVFTVKDVETGHEDTVDLDEEEG